MKRFLLSTVAAAAIVGFYAACSDNQSVAPKLRVPSASPKRDVSASSNGEGQCMFLDAVDAGFKTDKLQCTANDVSIGEADVNFYCIYNQGDPVCNPTTPLASGDRISCIPGQHIVAKISAVIQNSAQERFDMGLWILDPGLTGDANTGSQCRQYNLIPGQNGAVNLDGDQCGDVNSTTSTINVPLDNMDLVCPGNGQTTLSIQACAGWSNSTSGGNDVVCPIPGVTPASDGFRQGTTPPEGSKCKCNTLPLQIDVRGVLRIKKVTVPSGSAQSFDFTTTGTGYTTPFSLTDGNTNSSGALSAGTYTATETVPLTGWDLTGRTCVNTGDQSAHTFSNITNGVSVALAAGQDVTCTFTNTQRPKLTVNKICAPTTDGGHFNLQIDAATAGTGANVACGGTTGAVEQTIGAHSTGETAAGTTVLTDYFAPVFGGDCNTSGGITLAAGDNKTCTITNSRRPKLTVNKICSPTTDGGHFNLQIDAATAGTGANAACGGTTGAVLQTIGAHSTGETAAGTTVLTDYAAPVFGGDCNTSGGITLAAGDNKSCSITNRRLSTIIIEKEVVGGGTQSFTFTRTLSTGVADAGNNPAPTLQNGGSSSSGNTLPAGNYKVCETGLPVAFVDPTAAGYTLAGDGLGDFCATFALGWGETKTIHFVNTIPPGGGTRTIGYWKNWSSCANGNGNQYAKAIAAGHPEQTLDGNLPSVFPIGLITTLTTCQAVNLLNKNAINGDSRPGDPIYNFVAQLLGAKLNVAAGAGTCSLLTTALGQAQQLLVDISFNGTGSYKAKNALTATQTTLANSLNTTLTAYNEGTLGGGCPTHI